MNCPQCKSSRNKKNGFRRGKQSYRCKDCPKGRCGGYMGRGIRDRHLSRFVTDRECFSAYGCQYVENPKPRGYPNEVKQLCLKMYLNGMGFRAIARVTEIDHATIINWVKEKGEKLSDDPQDEEIPEITEIVKDLRLVRAINQTSGENL